MVFTPTPTPLRPIKFVNRNKNKNNNGEKKFDEILGRTSKNWKKFWKKRPTKFFKENFKQIILVYINSKTDYWLKSLFWTVFKYENNLPCYSRQECQILVLHCMLILKYCFEIHNENFCAAWQEHFNILSTYGILK